MSKEQRPVNQSIQFDLQFIGSNCPIALAISYQRCRTFSGKDGEDARSECTLGSRTFGRGRIWLRLAPGPDPVRSVPSQYRRS